MTYRKPYFVGGALCDEDEECLIACELQRLVEEADGAVIPTIDLTDPQADE